MKRWLPAIVLTFCLPFLVGWAMMFVNGGGNPFAPPGPTNLVTIDKCASNVATPAAGASAPITLTLTVGANEGLISLHKGTTNGTDPGVQDSFPGQGGAGNVWSSDLGTLTNSVNSLSAGCLNVDYVPISRFTGADNVTANAPGTGLFNSHILCTIQNFAGIDTSGGAAYQPNNGVGVTLANTGTLTPDVVNSLAIGMYHVETLSSQGSFVGVSSNSTPQGGAPTDLTFTLNSAQANANMLIGAASEKGILGSALGFQRNVTPLSNFCGGIVALTNTITALNINPGSAAVAPGGTQQFTATATIGGNPATRSVTPYATWTSSNTSVATINTNGLATVLPTATNGQTTTITGIYSGFQGVSTLTVTVSGTFPQFTNTGQFLTSFTPGTSRWLRSGYNASSTIGASATDFKAAGFNYWEAGDFWPIQSGPNAANDNFGCSWNVACYGTQWQAQIATPFKNRFATEGMPYSVLTDQTMNSTRGLLFDMPQAAGVVQYISQQLYLLGVNNNMMVNQISQDEIGSCDNACGDGTLLDGFGIGFAGDSGAEPVNNPNPANGCNSLAAPACQSFAPNSGGVYGTAKFNHVPWGADTFGLFTNYWWTVTSNNSAPSFASDYPVFESTVTGSGTFAGASGNTAAYLARSKSADASEVAALAAKPNVPTLWSGGGNSSCYTLNHTGRPFNFVPGTDTINAAAGCGTGVTPGLAIDQIFYAVSHGYQGVRLYKYDQAFTCAGRNGGATGALYQVGFSSVADWNATSSCAGQDKFYAMAVAYNLIQSLEPYILQPAMAAPSTAPGAGACDSFPGNTATGDPIICGAKTGNGGRLVIIENYSNTSSTYTYNPSIYWFGAGTTASAWRINDSRNTGGPNNWVCGAQQSCYANGTNGNVAVTIDPFTNGAPYDCFNGETTINGVSPPLTSSFTVPAAEPAPTGTTTLSMAPQEVDVFLYHP